MGHVFVAGSEAVDPGTGSRVEVGQTYVQFAYLVRPRYPFPVLLLPGGSLSGAVYETTPDGRPGWQSDFLAAGFSVLVADLGQTGRSPPAPPALQASPPATRGKAFLWETFRIGPTGSWHPHPSARRAYPQSRFPIQAFDSFARQAFPRYPVSTEQDVMRYGAILDRFCPCIVVAHSAAGPLAERAALARPDKVAALVLVEPSGGIGLSPAQARRLNKVPHLFLWGDYLDQAGWAEQYRGASVDRQALATGGAATETIDLPRNGIAGNSHMLMLDSNSREIAQLMVRWLARKSVTGGRDRPRRNKLPRREGHGE
jgi:pimeloyl-ACP methyl ester carboxylesterase